jgi:hypothetical protein
LNKLITADLHLNPLERDKYRHDAQAEIRRLVKKLHVRWVIILGDLTDEKDFHSATLVNRVVNHIYELKQLVEMVIVVMGNHDYTDIAQTPYFAFLHRLDGVVWVSKPTPGSQLPTNSSTDDKAFAKDIFLPHSPDPERDWENINFEQYKYAFAHNTFAGAKGDNGQQLNGPSVSLFPKHLKVLSGDVHVPQTIGPVTYVGPPYRIDFGDNFVPRVMLQHPDGQIAPETMDGPRKYLVECKAGEPIAAATKDLMEELAPGDMLKVRVTLKEGQYADWGNIKDEIQQWATKHRFNLYMVQPMQPKTRMTKKKTDRQPVRSDKEVLTSFATRQEVDAETLKVGMALLEKA